MNAIIIQARLSSKRLPNKILLPLGDSNVIHQIINRLLIVSNIDYICVAIPDSETDNELYDYLHVIQNKKLLIFRGSESNVLKRFHDAIIKFNFKNIVRVTSDCPLCEYRVIDTIIDIGLNTNFEYVRTKIGGGFPIGYDCEFISSKLIIEAYNNSDDPYEKEHVTPYIWRNQDNFNSLDLDFSPNLSNWRLVLDEVDDYKLISKIYERLYKGDYFGFEEIKKLFNDDKSLLNINSHVIQNKHIF